MNALRQMAKRSLWAGVGMAAILAAGCAGTSGKARVNLTGGQEVPPVGGNNSGTADITIFPTKCPSSATSNSCQQVFGTVTASGFVGTVAHIHRGKAGQNGPVIVPLTKTGENTWVVPDRTFMSDSDFGGYQDGELYVNVHSANNPGGEIRGQLVP